MTDEGDKKDVAMKRPGNILNPSPNADRRIDTRIKSLVFWWSGVTLFYLRSGLEISEKNGQAEPSLELFGIQFDGFTEQKFLIGLLILNVVFWVRLIWRILISKKYNKYYDDAVREAAKEKKYEEKYIQNLYKKNMKGFNRFEKLVLGLGIPFGMGFVAIAFLICHLIFGCLSWPKMVFCFEIVALAFASIAFVFALIELFCKYYYESEKNNREDLLSRIYFF